MSRTWHNGDKTVSLRLALTLVKTLAERLNKLVNAEPTAELFTECVKLHLISNDKERTMPFLRWNAQQRCLQPNNTPGLPVQAVEKSLTNIIRLMEDAEVLCFEASTRGSGDHEADSLALDSFNAVPRAVAS